MDSEIRAAWTARQLSTEPIDRPAAETAISELYEAAGFEPPRHFFWFDSPWRARTAMVVLAEPHCPWRRTFSVMGLIWVMLWRTWFHDRPFEQPGISLSELEEIGEAAPRRHAGMWRVLFRSRQTWLLMGMYGCYVWGSWFYFSWFPTFLVRGVGLNEKQMSLFSALPFILGCGGNLVGGMLSDRLASRYGLKVARCGQAASSLALSSLLILGLANTTDKVLVVILSSIGFGVLDLMLPATWSLCLDLGRSHAGVLTGAMNSAGLAGGFVCTVLFGYLVRATGGYRAPLSAVAAMVMLSAILFMMIDPNRPVWKEGE
jgi:predicted MFS family arabinose efflux permease